ncbi:MAG: sigma-70 family RNA polymerase sigma factor [Candidatus Krumholzibacteriota bacterium]|nr:sigma-70 family RNA polymerase sigma factor [Candidatus Krumholzibacteriota bacterium]
MVAVPRQSEASDQALLDCALADPTSPAARRAASLLLGRYRERIYLWCFRYVRDHERALDMAQEVLISAYRRLDSFGGRARFGSWLFAITRNRCLSEIRRPRLLYDEAADPEGLAATGKDPARELEERLDEETTLRLIRRTLEPREQEALWLRCFERLPVEAITRVLEVEDRSGARALLQRARRKLRASLAVGDPGAGEEERPWTSDAS